jgi:hypothetical protein
MHDEPEGRVLFQCAFEPMPSITKTIAGVVSGEALIQQYHMDIVPPE